MDRPQFSDILAERRRQLGFSIGQASRVLRLKEDVLVAFEEGDFSRMPKSGYAQGMLSSYARYLGLDAAELCDIFVKDYERYRHGEGRRASGGRTGSAGSSHQTYVAPRGLLPTSGGLAGDLGSFATTRVRSRAAYPQDSDADEGAPAYAQERPYTGRAPSRTRRAPHGSTTRRRGDIHTMRYDDEFEDDLRLGRDARSFESASSKRGRASSRNIGNTQRPRVRRAGATSSRGTNSRGGGSARRGQQRRGGIVEQLFGDSSQLVVLVVVGVILILSVILVISIGSCVRQNTDSARTVPVADASSVDDAATGDAADKDAPATQATDAASTSDASQTDPASTDGAAGTGSGDQTQASSSKRQETSVSVSIADGAVAWLEVQCDGKSDVADTITGPWQRTYTVEESLSVQTNNTTAVTVVQNGRQLQFDSMASGIGTLRVQGTGTSSRSKSASKSADAGDDGSGSTSARIGNASQGEGHEGGADTGGQDASAQDGDATGAASDGGSAGQTVYDYDDYGNPIYGYDDYGNPIYGYDDYGNPIY